MLILPMGFAAALSPMMLTEQTVVLAGRDGRRAARMYAWGTAVVATVYVGALVAFGRAISLPTRPKLNAGMDIALGVLLVLIAVLIHRRRPAPKEAKPPRAEMGAVAAFGFGVFSMATNFTSLAILLPAAKSIAASSVIVVGRVVFVALLVVLTTMPAWVPIATTRVAPGTAERGLNSLSDLIGRYGRSATVGLIGALGLVLVARGAWHIITD